MKRIPGSLAILLMLFAACNNQNKNSDSMSTSTTKDSIFFNSGYSDVNGIKMYYEKHGNKGDYLVLIHGGGSTISTSFSTIIPMLAKDFRVIAAELQAHGRTGDRNAAESFEQDADDVAALLHNLQINKASFLGFSNGGNTAMQVAIRHPQIVNKLVIASAFYKRGGMFPGFFEGMENATLKDMPQPLQDAFLRVNPDSNALQNMFNKDRQRMLSFKDWPDETLGAIKAPALIISGDHDVTVNSHTVAMAALIKNSRLMIIPATHGSYIGVEESAVADNKIPAMTVGIVTDFLNSQ